MVAATAQISCAEATVHVDYVQTSVSISAERGKATIYVEDTKMVHTRASNAFSGICSDRCSVLVVNKIDGTQGI